MSDPTSPRDVVMRLLEGISNQQWSLLADLYADDAVVAYPFALPAPRRLEGRPSIRRYFDAVARFPLELRARDIVVHETADPDTVVVEYDYDARNTATGRSVPLSNIQVTTVRDGRIVSSRDFHNHVAMADALGQLGDLLAAMTTDPDPGT